MKKVFKKVTINTLLKEDSDSVYVINKTGADRGRSEAGVIHLSISPGNNEQPLSVIVPHTWAPFDLSTQMPKSQLLSSTQFRRAVGIEMILLVAADEAEDYFKNNREAAIENDRANQSLFGIEQSIEAMSNKNNSEKNSALIEKLERSNDKFAVTQVDFDPEISGKNIDISLIEIINRNILEKDVSEIEMYNTVRSVENKKNGLSSDEKEYILNNVKFDKVLKFVQDHN